MGELEKIGKTYKTDKCSNQHNYLDLYEKILPHPLVAKNILEIGLWFGASARMWHDYYSRAHIYMVENDTNMFRNWEEAYARIYKRVEVIFTDQTDIAWASLPEMDFVIDDGGHDPKKTIQSFQRGFHRVKPGGFWIIEDTHAYWDKEKNYPSFLFDYFVNKAKIMQCEGDGYGNFYKARERHGLEGNDWFTLGISFYKSLIIVEKTL